MKYKIIHEFGESLTECIKKLEKEVNELCEAGWEPQGGLFVISKDYEYAGELIEIAQAMIKEE